MGGVCVGVEQGYGDRVVLTVFDPIDGGIYGAHVQRYDAFAVKSRAFGHFEDIAALQ